jgi:hypothetical protein
MHRGNLSALEGPEDGKYTKTYLGVLGFGFHIFSGLFALGHCSQFRVVDYQKRLVSLVVLACWDCRGFGSDDNREQPASTCGQERLRTPEPTGLWVVSIASRSPRNIY